MVSYESQLTPGVTNAFLFFPWSWVYEKWTLEMNLSFPLYTVWSVPQTCAALKQQQEQQQHTNGKEKQNVTNLLGEVYPRIAF